MLKSIKFALFTVVIGVAVFGLSAALAAPAPQTEGRLFPYSPDGAAYGYVDETGAWVIEPQFSYAANFAEGLAVVIEAGQYGYIDESGSLAIEPQFDFAEDFVNGLALVSVEGKLGYIDETGSLAIEPQFKDASPFADNGLAPARLAQEYGYIDQSGAFVIEPQFESAFDFAEGLAAVVVDGQFGFIDETGAWVIEPQFSYAADFAEGLAVVGVEGQAGYINASGDVVIEPQFAFALDFAEGLAAVSVNEQVGYIDPTGAFAIEPQFEFGDSFSEGLAAVLINDQLGYIDQSGQLVIAPEYDLAEPFQGGLARVEQAHRWGVIDPTGAPQFTLPVMAETPAETLINLYIPEVPAEVRDGICLTQSVTIPQPYAWRCLFVGDEAGETSVFDPCLTAANGQTIVCGYDPLSGAAGFQVNLIEPLPEPAEAGGDIRPWQVQLADGSVCGFLSSVRSVVDGKPANYLCTDNSVLLGELQPGPVWQAEQVALADVEGNFDDGFTAADTHQAAVSIIWQPVDPALVLDRIGLLPGDVSLNTNGIAEIMTSQIRPPTPLDPDALAGLSGEPAHLRYTFDGSNLPKWGGVYRDEAQLLIYPVEPYLAIYEEAGDDTVARRIERLQTLLAARPATIDGEIPLLPGLGEATQDLAVQVEYLDFNGGSGVRFITHYGVGPSPITDFNTFYTFQGLTDDGQFYVAYFHPADTELLPRGLDAVAPLIADYDAFIENYDTYLQETTDTLDQAATSDFLPDLANLDAMLTSLQVGQPVE